MSLPALANDGNLPQGVHTAELSQILEALGGPSPRRRLMAQRLERIYRVALSTGRVARFIVFGSFVTAKPEPNDVDIFMIMDDAFELDKLDGEARLLFDHGAADTFFGASVFWLRRLAALNGEEAAVNYWQIRRDGGMRGIVEIVGGVDDSD